jgi:hypothetical protein
LSKPLKYMGFANPPSPLGKDLVLTVSSIYSRKDWLKRSSRTVEDAGPYKFKLKFETHR